MVDLRFWFGECGDFSAARGAGQGAGGAPVQGNCGIVPNGARVPGLGGRLAVPAPVSLAPVFIPSNPALQFGASSPKNVIDYICGSRLRV